MSLSQASGRNSPDDDACAKRRRGRPRKHHPKLHSEEDVAGRIGVVDNNPMVGRAVVGAIEAVFDAGYFLTVRVANSDVTLRGIVFRPGHFVPVSAENDVAPGVKMIRRDVIPAPPTMRYDDAPKGKRPRDDGEAFRNDEAVPARPEDSVDG